MQLVGTGSLHVHAYNMVPLPDCRDSRPNTKMLLGNSVCGG